ncbi:MAG: dephospho-CoA kinase [Bacteroidales bacterium]|nr:dephospho-CoA kinase [Bacteroidales bacterium]
MRTVAVTGGIGAGKSTVCALLSRRGVPVYDSDAAAKRLYSEDDSLLDSIEEAFGRSVRTADKRPDFKKIASIVFSSPEKLRALESIVHPAVTRDFRRWKASRESYFENLDPGDMFFGAHPFCVIESAIILDKPEILAIVDYVVLVDAPLQTRLRRACERDGSDPADVLRRMSAQRLDLSKVDAVIRNDGSPEDLAPEVKRVFSDLGNI